MIGISKLYCGTVEPSDALRYGRHSSTLPSHLLQFSKDKRPVVVWNITRKCNLKCVHCYAHATEDAVADELSTAEGKALIDDLAQFGAPVMLFSGGEPLVRKDLPELAAYAVDRGMRAVISTNGTLITAQMARTSKPSGSPMSESAWTACRGSTINSEAFPAPMIRPLPASTTARKRASKSACALRSTGST
ncbi:radical SAM protein [Desulfosarcina cetonica]|uniref:radical SAM protein n=1 Tax=Desulfosarcina cetonica TaxID=90730 RepID=UPI00278C6ADC|nr:radical SAM protein [Desulfosarcina cetonica]